MCARAGSPATPVGRGDDGRVSLEHAAGPDVTFGLFDWVDADGAREAGQLYRERLDLVADAEAHGFDVYHLAEHHGTPLGLAPSPNVLLAAAAVRTTRIRLCPLVYVLPLYHPARLAEEIAMLDQLSDGRLEIGFGKGGNPYELLAYGVDPAEAQRRCDETLDALMRALETGVISADGAQMPVRTRQLPHPPLWYPSSNPQSVALLGKRGINTILGFSFRSPSIEETRRCRDEYFAGVAAAPEAAAPEGAAGGAGRRVPRFGIMRNIYVGDSDREARDRAIEAMEVFYRQFTAVWRRHGDPRFAEPQDFGRAIDEGRILAGSAAAVRARLAAMIQASGCNHVAGAFAFGSLSYAEASASLARFAEEVAPGLRDPGRG
jgi:alkanesulfonate monooxygenase SsuD/methylene tetrahydromethanopterin reductase-like flavin-dependent oxidoreductase (luciferase family)